MMTNDKLEDIYGALLVAASFVEKEAEELLRPVKRDRPTSEYLAENNRKFASTLRALAADLAQEFANTEAAA